MAEPSGYKLAVGALFAVAGGLWLWTKFFARGVTTTVPSGTITRPPEEDASTVAAFAWNAAPSSAFAPSAPTSRGLTGWEKSVLAAYFRPDLLDVAVIHLGQWDGETSPNVLAHTLNRDIYFHDPLVVFTDPVSMATLAHELFHVAEFATGMTIDQYAEGKAAAAAGHPETNPFEAPAYSLGQQVLTDLLDVGSSAVSGVCACS